MTPPGGSAAGCVARRHVVWVGLGSNLREPAQQVEGAIDELSEEPGLTLLAASALYRTTPVGGPGGQPDYCNACAALATAEPPLAVLDTLQRIERAHDRARNVRWGPRTLDLDMIAFDDRVLTGPRLTLPHPRAHARGFVLVPLAEIAPALGLGQAGRVIDCLGRADTCGVARWAESG